MGANELLFISGQGWPILNNSSYKPSPISRHNSLKANDLALQW
jgi:hypothetical protein